MAKSQKLRKPVSAASKAIITLAVLLAVTVFVSCLAVSGLHYGTDGIMQLLPWVPTSVENWPESLTPGISMGGGTYYEFTAQKANVVKATEEGAADTTEMVDATADQLNAAAAIARKRLNTLGYTDTSVSVKDGKIRVELPNVDVLSDLAAMIAQTGKFTFTNPDSSEFMDGSVVTNAVAGATGATGHEGHDHENEVYYVVNLTFNEEGKKAFGDATAANVGGSLSVYRDGQLLSSPGVSEAITEGVVSLPLGLEGPATACAAAQFVSGPYDVTLTLADSGAVSAEGNNKLATFLWVMLALMVLITIYALLRYRVSAIAVAWTMWTYVLLSMFFYATVVNARMSIGVVCVLLLALVFQGWLLIEKFTGMANELRSGRMVRQSFKTGFSQTNKKVWIAIGGAFALSLIMMIFSFSAMLGNVLCGCVVAIAINTLIMPSILESLLISATGEKTGLYLGKGK